MNPYRLPTHILPTRYEIRLEPDLSTATFQGRETIFLSVLEGGTELVLNAAELSIDEATLEDDAGVSRACAVVLDEKTERCMIRPEGRVTAGSWRLHLAFRGILNEKLRGFYRSTYRAADGTERRLAATQFESTDARRAFPCWDEPAFKAVFAITLAIDPSLQAVANTAPADEHREMDRQVIRFTDTMRMSTYLVAFVVGDLEATPPMPVGRTPMRVVTVPGKAGLTRYAAEIGAFSLRWSEDYFGLPFPGDKLDQIAIPDFAAGAMENFGLITYRESALLLDESKASHAERTRVADTVSHEVSHMWFGDLVTMSWWNGLWLNEAFATLMELLAVDAWKPEWKRFTAFAVERAGAMLVDGLHNTRPVEFPVEDPADAEAMFDVLTYQKGASVLRMLEQHLGPELFREGVREYLRRHAYANADTADLWLAIQSAVPPRTDRTLGDIPLMMQGWVFQPGYPVLEIEREGVSLKLRQRRFTYLPADQRPAPTPLPEERWMVPVQIRIHAGGRDRAEQITLTGSEGRVDLPQGFEWVLVNAGGHGFYRVQYSAELLESLLPNLDRLDGIERFNLLADAWAATVAGLMSIRGYLDLTRHFKGETDPNVWTLVILAFETLARLIDAADRPGFAVLVRGRLAPVVARLGWEPAAGEDDLTRQLRGDVLTAMGTLGDDSGIQEEAADMFARVQSGARVDPNVMPALLAIMAYTGEATRYDEFTRGFRAARDPQEERRYLQSFAAFRPPELVRRTLESTLNGEFRGQDSPLLIARMLLHVHSREAAWEFLKAGWPEMQRKYAEIGIRNMWSGVTGLARPEWEEDVRRYMAKVKLHLGGRTVEQYLERLHIAVVMREREGVALSRYLKESLR
jgi:puromycin-sensitive aminopeptidase